MKITRQQWNKIREQFSQEEKDKLNSAVRAEIICPPTLIISAEKLGYDLLEKLCKALVELHKPSVTP